VRRVATTPWRSVGIAAMAVNGALLLAAGWYFVGALLILLSDDLLIGLTVLVAPIVLMGIGLCLTGVGWTIAAIRKLLLRDPAARWDLAGMGAVGLLAGVWLTATIDARLIVAVISSAAALVVAVAPAAWRPAPPRHAFTSVAAER